jgi:hypothetical protein
MEFLQYGQGDPIGRIFAYKTIAFFEQYLNITQEA